MDIKLEKKRLTVEMPLDNYKILKKFAVDRNTTLRQMIMQALREYISRNMGNI